MFIEFAGTISTAGASGGHYTCDTKDSRSGSWFRTNDSQIPFHIEASEVSKTAYVVLFKRA